MVWISFSMIIIVLIIIAIYFLLYKFIKNRNNFSFIILFIVVSPFIMFGFIIIGLFGAHEQSSGNQEEIIQYME